MAEKASKEPVIAEVPRIGTSSVDPSFTDNGRKARYGVAYLRGIFAQAGVSFTETSPDEDIMAIDGEIHFPRLSSRIQVKCTSKFKLTGKSATMTLEPEWVRKWTASFAPVYFVIVIVPESVPDWMTHPATSTNLKVAAYWVRFDPTVHGATIRVPKSQRLTIDTIHEWKRDLDELLEVAS